MGVGHVPQDDLITASDFVLMHGNGKSPSYIQSMIDQVKQSSAYKSNPMPIVYNEDNDANFANSTNNFETAVKNHVSWGYYDQGKNNYLDGYQSPPTDWMVDTSKKTAFFDQVKQYIAT